MWYWWPIRVHVPVRSVMGMDNLLNALGTVSQVSAVIFGVMVLTAMALASHSVYHRSRRRA